MQKGLTDGDQVLVLEFVETVDGHALVKSINKFRESPWWCSAKFSRSVERFIAWERGCRKS